jgi:hypothetical protein
VDNKGVFVHMRFGFRSLEISGRRCRLHRFHSGACPLFGALAEEPTADKIPTSRLARFRIPTPAADGSAADAQHASI